MAKQFLFNDSKVPRIMGGKLVPPGEGREVDAEFLLPGDAPQAATELAADDRNPTAGADDMSAFAQLPVNKLRPELPALSDEQLGKLEALERQREQPRSTVLAAIGELRLARAQAKTGAPT